MINNTLKTILKLKLFWKIKESPKRIFGWLLHEMWKISATNWTFAVKVLNPEIMNRPEAYDNFIFSEKVANIAKNAWIPAISAITNKEECLIKVHDKYYMVFPWIDWFTLSEKPAWKDFCYKIGKTLAQIHNLWIEKTTNISYEEMKIDINYLNILEKKSAGISQKITELQKKYNDNINFFNNELVISHKDIDQKNVLWNSENNPMIIDWEASWTINPMIELLSMALYWGWIVSGKVEKSSFKAVIKWYTEIRQIDYTNIQKYLFGCVWFIDWLMYNLKRSKDINNSDSQEIEIANNEITKTIDVINLFYSDFNKFNEWLN